MDFSALSERFAHSTKQAGKDDPKPACQAFGWIVRDGVFYAGLLYNPKQVRAKTLTFELYEPDKDNEPVHLGSVTVRLRKSLRPCKAGELHTNLELEVTSLAHS